jgi:hypothetical protein
VAWPPSGIVHVVSGRPSRESLKEALFVPDDQAATRFFSERRLRPLLRVLDPVKQVRQFRRLLAELTKGQPTLDS